MNANSIDGQLMKSITQGFYHGNFSKSIDIVNNILPLAPNYDEVHHALAQPYHLLGKYEKALIHRIKARDLNPLFWLYQSNLIETLMYSEKLDQAEMELKKAKQLFPEYTNRFNRFESRMALSIGEYQKCIDIASTLENNNEWDYARIASAYSHLGNKEKGQEYFDLINGEDSAMNALCRAMVYVSLDEMDNAINALNNAVDIRREEFKESKIGADLVYLKRMVMSTKYFEPFRNVPEYNTFLNGLSDVEPFD